MGGPVVSAVGAGSHEGKEVLMGSQEVMKRAMAHRAILHIKSGHIPKGNQEGARMHTLAFILSIIGFGLELTVFLMTVAVL
jgi:hypothetical protein